MHRHCQHIMNDYTRTRVELSQLEDRERWLLKELSDVRAAISTQRVKMAKILRTRPPVINHLPIEILLTILDFDIHSYPHPYPGRNYELAAVCRVWRGAILDSPSFWTTVHVAALEPSSIITHLERSRGALLDIVIESTVWSQSDHFALVPSLDAISSCTHRWRTLLITVDRDSDDDRSDSVALVEFVAKRINHLRFPSLRCAKILSDSYPTRLAFLSPARSPVLEHLELSDIDPLDTGVPPIPALKTLKLNFDGPTHPSLSYTIPTQALETLSLTGHTAITLQRDSIHFPVLNTLEMIYFTPAREFVDGIVVPNLERFKYVSAEPDTPPIGTGSKFTNVRHLHLSHPESECDRSPFLRYCNAEAICKSFPNVRHAELKADHWSQLFHPRPRRPIDLWTGLESITFCGLHPKWLEPDEFLAWLVERKASGLRRLHVKFTYFFRDECHDDVHFHSLYETLKETCTLEMDLMLEKHESRFNSKHISTFTKPLIHCI